MNRFTDINNNPNISWKGRTFTQISSIMKKNNVKSSNIGTIFLANPVKLYRKEIAANMDMSGCNSTRSSLKISSYETPNGLIVSSINNSAPNKTGVSTTLDINLTNNTSDIPYLNTACVNTATSTVTNDPYAFSKVQDTLKKVRSSGMIKKNFNAVSNKPTYYTDTKQYLISRCRDIEQNKIVHFSSGNSYATPGTNAASNNVYYTNGTTTCGTFAPIYYKPNNSQFAQQGGVSSSSLTNRIKYDNINKVSYQTSNTRLGNSVANAFAYGVSENPYTLKDKIGYPNIKTPIIDKYTGELKCNPNFLIRKGAFGDTLSC
jgi:hypothetical protein